MPPTRPCDRRTRSPRWQADGLVAAAIGAAAAGRYAGEAGSATKKAASRAGRINLSISGTTRVIGIIGWPVGHSLSPALHNAAFAALSLDYIYVPLPVAPDGVAAAVRGLPALGFWGANVTVPHKRAVVSYLDELDDDARLAGAVNTIVIRGARAQGYNTDIEGFGRAVLEAVPATPHDAPVARRDQPAALSGRPVLLLGAGGVARAAAVWLARAGADLTVVNRTPAAADEVVAVVRAAAPAATARALPLAALTAAHVAAAAVLVNATSLGMQGAGKVPAVVVDNVREDHVVCDVVYGRRPTPLIVQARKRGARAVDGLSILVWQAAAAFELWTGVAAPVDVMRSAVTR